MGGGLNTREDYILLFTFEPVVYGDRNWTDERARAVVSDWQTDRPVFTTLLPFPPLSTFLSVTSAVSFARLAPDQLQIIRIGPKVVNLEYRLRNCNRRIFKSNKMLEAEEIKI